MSKGSKRMSNLKRRSSDEGKLLVAEYKESGLSMKRFAEKSGVKLSSVQYWSSKVRKEKKAASAKVHFLEVIQAKQIPAPQKSSIELPGGIRIQTEELPPPEYLADLSEQFRGKIPC
jgi:transposase-like protein